MTALMVDAALGPVLRVACWLFAIVLAGGSAGCFALAIWADDWTERCIWAFFGTISLATFVLLLSKFLA